MAYLPSSSWSFEETGGTTEVLAVGAGPAGGGGGAATGASSALVAGATICGAGGAAGTALPWNQLCRQLAQRTCRPAAPMAVSGTT